MAREITSKNIEGITDLVVVAPIKQGFIHAYENVSYATRLRIVGEALNRVRVSAREHEKTTPFSDVTERILTLLDFRIGVIDRDLFALRPKPSEQDGNGGKGDPETELVARRFLYLTATFDGAWEPYMRLIWDPLGPFLDLLFCNCEGYVTASEHSFDEYAQWVRDHQVDSAIFYSTTGLTVRDHLYLNRLEQVQRSKPGAVSDRLIAGMSMPQPEKAAAAERADPAQLFQNHTLALEALTVLYRLADYYPPEWLAGIGALSEGHYLARAADSLLLGWDQLTQPPFPPLPPDVETIYADPLHWYRTGQAHVRKLKAESELKRPKDPVFRHSEIQGGILSPQGSRCHPMHQGALLLMTVIDAEAARDFLGALQATDRIHFEEGSGAKPDDGFFRTVALTADGLRRLGVSPDVLNFFPKEFREGMELRSGLIGDVRENHPRRWILPRRNWRPPAPSTDGEFLPAPPIEMSEIDLVLQVRTSSEDPEVLMEEIERLAYAASAGFSLQGYELMRNAYDEKGHFIDHFGFRDGISQPRPAPDLEGEVHKDDKVRLGEVVLGYRNDRHDFAPEPFGSHEEWRTELREEALGLQLDGTFMVIRKMEQHVEAFEQRMAVEAARINDEHRLPEPMTEERLKAKILGRYPDGRPLVPSSDGTLNNFDFAQDKEGEKCPLAAHIRRANPREPFQRRNAPRLVRRGMSFDHRDGDGKGPLGMMFMAYNASIAEQYETIQRWINGGNSTYIASGHGDPLIGVAPKTGALYPAERVFRFVEGTDVIRLSMPEPFTSLHWGLYLFVPSRTALGKLCKLEQGYEAMREMLETEGEAVIRQLDVMQSQGARGDEWKRLIEDFDAKDPALGDVTPDVWSAIRWYHGGSIKVPGGVPFQRNWDDPPPPDQPVVISASYRHVMQVLSDWNTFTTEEQLRRIAPTGIPIYVTQQPDNQYKASALQDKYDYRAESEATNEILMSYGEEDGFRDGYEAGAAIIRQARKDAESPPRVPPYSFKLELRRQYLLPALQELCRLWYGLPDDDTFHPGAWTWQSPDSRQPKGPRCPGDFLSPSRNAFYPRPSPVVGAFAEAHSRMVHEGSLAFVRKHRKQPIPDGAGRIARRMFDAVADDDVLARNLVGTMIGAIPPMDGNLRGILLEWFVERTFWRHQAALREALDHRLATADFAKARDVLFTPVSQAMCKRPAPDLLYRTALKETELKAGDGQNAPRFGRDVPIKERDLVVVSLVSAAQRSLTHSEAGDVSIVFGGKRRHAYQPAEEGIDHPVHACPARPMAMGAIMGILAALLDSGRIQPLPASLIVKFSEWE